MINTTYLHNCPACLSRDTSLSQRFSSGELIRAWQKMAPEAGQYLSTALEQGEIPEVVQFYVCKDCKLEFANPMFAADGEWYSKIEKECSKLRWEHIRCLNQLKSPLKILEIGCADGNFLELAVKNGHKAIGLDFSEQFIKQCQYKGLEAYNWDLKTLQDKLKNYQFDAIMLFHVIEHIDNLDSFFEDLKPLTKPETRLFFSCPSPKRFSPHLFPDMNLGNWDYWDYPPQHQTHWNKDALDKLLSRLSWQLKSYEYEPFDLRGTSTTLVARDALKKGIEFSSLSSTERKVRIFSKMLRNSLHFFNLSGWSLYCTAIQQ